MGRINHQTTILGESVKNTQVLMAAFEPGEDTIILPPQSDVGPPTAEVFAMPYSELAKAVKAGREALDKAPRAIAE